MRAVDIIRRKRDGEPLSRAQIDWMVRCIATGEVADYQWSALLMAIYYRSMNAEETVALTEAMMRSGTVVDLSEIPGPKIDKHSTGGVGDKTSLILAPVAAAAGVLVPMVSGRGLGHTGGTLDKLESIPGLRVNLNLREYKDVLRRCGLVMIGQTEELAPADRFLYGLRDATATVESIPLIASSILSKKLAEGIDGLVLDVKAGDGAFLTDEAEALKLAATMAAISTSMGKRVVTLVTCMEQPLGRAVGNAVEVVECLDCLRGGGPDDLIKASLELAARMVLLGGKAASLNEAFATCRQVIADGRALERFRGMVEAQGGDPAVVDDPGLLPEPRRRVVVHARSGGFVQAIAARSIGHASMLLGAGRARMDSRVDHAVGLILHRKVGDPVVAGEPLCTLLVNDESRLDEVQSIVSTAYRIGDEAPVPLPLIRHRFDEPSPSAR